jgi:site-specific recombinase XerD
MHSLETRDKYEKNIICFLEHHKLQSIDELVELSGEVREHRMIDFIVACKKKGVTAGTIAGYLSALWHFYHYNGIVYTNLVRVRGYMGKHA